tara:strand:+ start:18116 stop:19324 length:1209 start_codon:yes stop_codon:yes gene_type:complete
MKFEKLGDHIEQVRGISYKPDYVINIAKDGYLPILRSNNIEEGKINFANLIFLPSELVKEKQKLKEGDILITASTGSKKAIGKNGAASQNFDAAFGAFCKVVRPKKSIDKNYLKHFFQTSYYRNTIRDAVNGANINNIKNGHLNDLKIPLAPLVTQKKIAAILDAADAHRQKTKQLLAKYDELAQSIFLDMFGDPAVDINRWSNYDLVDLALSNKDVKCGPFGTQLSKSEYTEKGVPVWGIPQINSNFIKAPSEFVSDKKAKELEQYSVVEGDIVMSRKGNVGACALFTENQVSGILHSDAIKIRLDQRKILPIFLIWQFRLSRLLQTQVGNVSSGAIMAGINVTKLKRVQIVVPDYELQRSFKDRLALVDKQKSNALEALKKGEGLFNSLLQKAFNGEFVK